MVIYGNMIVKSEKILIYNHKDNSKTKYISDNIMRWVKNGMKKKYSGRICKKH